MDKPDCYFTLSLNVVAFLRINGLEPDQVRRVSGPRSIGWYYCDGPNLRRLLSELRDGTTDTSRLINRFLDAKRSALTYARKATTESVQS